MCSCPAVGAGDTPVDASPTTGIPIVSEEATKMKPRADHEIAGRVHEVKGKIKQKVGQLTNNPTLEAKGVVENIAGKIQKKIGRVQKAVEKR
jgi:uncharacterized protein YjbJ (UPF0337 family)